MSTGKNKRAIRGLEVGKNLSSLFECLIERPDIPVSLFGLLMDKNGIKPRQIKRARNVENIFDIFEFDGQLLIFFCFEEEYEQKYGILYKDHLITLDACTNEKVIFGDDDAILVVEGCNVKNALFFEYWISKAAGIQSQTCTTVINEEKKKSAVCDDFIRKRGVKKSWIKYSITGENNDEDSEEKKCSLHTGSLGDLQIGIINSNGKLYQVILGWAEDFQNAKHK